MTLIKAVKTSQTLSQEAAERAIRPLTVGRKNRIMIDTIKGAQASAVLYSIVETCKANDIKIYEYIRYLLEELPKTIHDLTVEVPDRLLSWSKELPDNIYGTIKSVGVGATL